MVSKILQFADTSHVIISMWCQMITVDCKCIGAWNFWPRTRLTVNKLKRHIFVCFYNIIHILYNQHVGFLYVLFQLIEIQDHEIQSLNYLRHFNGTYST